MRIAWMTGALAAGGAERVLVSLANQFHAAGHEVALVTYEMPGQASFYPVDPGVTRFQLGIASVGGRGRLYRAWLRCWRTRSVLARWGADVAVAFMDPANLYAVLAGIGRRRATLISERVDLSRHRLGPLHRLARALVYPFADRIVVQTAHVARTFPAYLQRKLVRIPNGVRPATRFADPATPLPDGTFRILAVGRLTQQKALERLVAAFARLAADFPQWRVCLYGEGDARAALEAQVREAGLAERVTLPGIEPDIEAELARAHLFVMPSRYEGFPNALAEALACGLPAIAYRDVSGIAELIDPGRNGLAIDDAQPVDALAEALRALMGDAPRRAAMGRAARDVSERYAPARIFALWEAALREARGA